MRRRFLILAASAPAILSAASRQAAAAARRPRPVPRRLQLRHMSTGARFAGAYHDGNAADPVAMAELSQVLADTRTGAVHPFDPRALDVLWQVARRAQLGGEMLILSGYRTPESNAIAEGAADSQHLRAGALDVHLPAAQITGFGETALAAGLGGVGIYARRGFVHLDSGPVRRWGDVPVLGPDGTVIATAAAKPRPKDRLSLIAEAWASTRGR